MEMLRVCLAALKTCGNPSLLPLLISWSCEHKGWGVKSEIKHLVCLSSDLNIPEIIASFYYCHLLYLLTPGFGEALQSLRCVF